MQLYGLERATKDIDLLVDPDPANVARVVSALSVLADGVAREVAPGDVAAYTVVRIADEVVVDLLGSACGLTLAELGGEIRGYEVQGVAIPFLSPTALIRTKQTVRPQDAADRAFLARVAAEEP
jgi:hypothetical protein